MNVMVKGMIAGLVVFLCQCATAETNAPAGATAADAAEAKLLAAADFTNGVYRLQTYGLMAGKMIPQEEYLKKHYNVDIWPVAECIVPDGVRAKAVAYNAEMKRRLVQKFGKDIFEEAKKATADR